MGSGLHMSSSGPGGPNRRPQIYKDDNHFDSLKKTSHLVHSNQVPLANMTCEIEILWAYTVTEQNVHTLHASVVVPVACRSPPSSPPLETQKPVCVDARQHVPPSLPPAAESVSCQESPQEAILNGGGDHNIPNAKNRRPHNMHSSGSS